MPISFRRLKVLTCLLALAGRLLLALLIGKLRIRSEEETADIVGSTIKNSFVSLSGAFIKFGQLLAMRPDLVHPQIVQNLSSLLDNVPAEPFSLSKKTILGMLRGAEILGAFSFLSGKPLAAASFATVYEARLLDGTRVAVKVQRNGIDKLVAADISILRLLAYFVDSIGILKRFNLSAIVQSFSEWTNEELDYEREGRNLEFVRDRIGEMENIVVPKVYWDFTSKRVLVMDFIEGEWVSQIKKQRQSVTSHPHLSAQKIAARHIFYSMMKQVFEFGFFHADPHAGNICLMANGKIGLIDFGMIGFLDEYTRNNQLNLLSAVQRNDLSSAFRSVKNILEIPPDADLSGFRQKFEGNVRDWRLLRLQPTLSARDRSASHLLLMNFQAARDSGVAFNSVSARYYRAFIVLDTVLFELDPEFDHIELVKEYWIDKFERESQGRAKELIESEAVYERAQIWAAINNLPSLLRKIEDAIDVAGRPSELVDNVFSNSLSRMSRVVASISSISSIVGFLFILSGLLLAVSGERLDVTPTIWLIPDHIDWKVASMSGIALVVVGGISRWLSLILWIRAYRPSRTLLS